MADSTLGSGDGTRPTTDGGVDNIGGAGRLGQGDPPAGETTGPGPQERMQNKRSDVDASKHDDSDAYYLHEDLSAQPNTEPADPQGLLDVSDPSRRR
jgi:hypothetical protein